METDILTFKQLVISFLQNAVQVNLQNANQRVLYARTYKNIYNDIASLGSLKKHSKEKQTSHRHVADGGNPNVPHFTYQNKAFYCHRVGSICIAQSGAGP